MKKLSILLFMFMLSILSINAKSEYRYKIVFKVIHSWDKVGKSAFPKLPEASIDDSTLTISFYSEKSVPTIIQIKDKSGNVIFQDNINSISQYHYYVNMQDYPKGSYNLVVLDENIEVHGRFDI